MLLRCLLLPLLALAAGCGADPGARPTQEQTYYCGSYERAGPGTTSTEPPC